VSKNNRNLLIVLGILCLAATMLFFDSSSKSKEPTPVVQFNVTEPEHPLYMDEVQNRGFVYFYSDNYDDRNLDSLIRIGKLEPVDYLKMQEAQQAHNERWKQSHVVYKQVQGDHGFGKDILNTIIMLFMLAWKFIWWIVPIAIGAYILGGVIRWAGKQ